MEMTERIYHPGRSGTNIIVNYRSAALPLSLPYCRVRCSFAPPEPIRSRVSHDRSGRWLFGDAEEGVDEPRGIERLDILRRFAQADELHRDVELLADRR